MEKKTIGKFISSLRKANGYTQQELADILCVSNKTISSWENDNSAPDLSMIPIIAELFSVSCDELLAGEKRSPIGDSNEKALANKAEIMINGQLKKMRLAYQNQSYISMGIFAISAIMLLLSIRFAGDDLLSKILMVIGVSLYIGGIIFSLVTYNNAYNKGDINDAMYSDYYRFIKKRLLIIQCLYSFFILSWLFCAMFNKQIQEKEIYQLSIEQSATLKRNLKIKRILTLVYGMFTVILIAVYFTFNAIKVDADIYAPKYTQAEINNSLYTLTFYDNAIACSSFNSSMSISFHNDKYPDLNFERQTLCFELFNLDIATGSKLSVSDDFSIYAIEDNKICLLYKDEIVLLDFEKRIIDEQNWYYYSDLLHDDIEIKTADNNLYKIISTHYPNHKQAYLITCHNIIKISLPTFFIIELAIYFILRKKIF